jgi:hypothetical protein
VACTGIAAAAAGSRLNSKENAGTWRLSIPPPKPFDLLEAQPFHHDIAPLPLEAADQRSQWHR